jgi:hypothetical protein
MRDFVAAGFPPEKTERLRILSNVLESDRELSAAEDAELLTLEREFARISRERLNLWFDR